LNADRVRDSGQIERDEVRASPRLDRAQDFLGPCAAVPGDLDPLK